MHAALIGERFSTSHGSNLITHHPCAGSDPVYSTEGVSHSTSHQHQTFRALPQCPGLIVHGRRLQHKARRTGHQNAVYTEPTLVRTNKSPVEYYKSCTAEVENPQSLIVSTLMLSLHNHDHLKYQNDFKHGEPDIHMCWKNKQHNAPTRLPRLQSMQQKHRHQKLSPVHPPLRSLSVRWGAVEVETAVPTYTPGPPMSDIFSRKLQQQHKVTELTPAFLLASRRTLSPRKFSEHHGNTHPQADMLS